MTRGRYRGGVFRLPNEQLLEFRVPNPAEVDGATAVAAARALEKLSREYLARAEILGALPARRLTQRVLTNGQNVAWALPSPECVDRRVAGEIVTVLESLAHEYRAPSSDGGAS